MSFVELSLDTKRAGTRGEDENGWSEHRWRVEGSG
jgi:hypothetical protein